MSELTGKQNRLINILSKIVFIFTSIINFIMMCLYYFIIQFFYKFLNTIIIFINCLIFCFIFCINYKLNKLRLIYNKDMPNFKPKSNKKLKFNKKSAVTLDIKHKEFINEFDKDENDRIPEFKYERQELKKQLNNPEISVEQRLDI